MQRFGWRYVSILEQPDQGTGMVTDKGKGKQPSPKASSPHPTIFGGMDGGVPTSPKGAKGSPSKKDKSPTRKNVPTGAKPIKGGLSEKAKHPTEEENPLHVKGEPKSKALSEDQRKTLRKFFKLTEGLVPPEEWKAMNTKERSLAMAERSLPKWATNAVLKRSSNLELILKGELTKETVNGHLSVTQPKKVGGSSQAIEAWQSLKSDFKGVQLFRNPVTSKEKAFKKRFDSLVSDYGDQKCFPKLREHPDQQGRGRSSSRRGGTTDSGMGAMLQMAKAMGEIARAFKS